jgi:hypothetical protein
MAKFEWDGKEIESAEWLARTLQKNKAEAALKKHAIKSVLVVSIIRNLKNY